MVFIGLCFAGLGITQILSRPRRQFVKISVKWTLKFGNFLKVGLQAKGAHYVSKKLITGNKLGQCFF